VIFVRDQFAELFLRDVRLALMEDVEDEFLSGQQFVDSKSSGFDCDSHKIIIFILKNNNPLSLPSFPFEPPSTVFKILSSNAISLASLYSNG